VAGVLPLSPKASLAAAGVESLPTAAEPSDHVMIAADLTL
jgi:hypothetical protein